MYEGTLFYLEKELVDVLEASQKKFNESIESDVTDTEPLFMKGTFGEAITIYFASIVKEAVPEEIWNMTEDDLSDAIKAEHLAEFAHHICSIITELGPVSKPE